MDIMLKNQMEYCKVYNERKRIKKLEKNREEKQRVKERQLKDIISKTI